MAPPLNLMDLKIFYAPARLATPAISLEDFAAELAISFRGKPQAGSLCSDSFQNVLKKDFEAIAAREGRSVAQVCDAFLKASSEIYMKKGPKFLQRFLSRQKKESSSE